MGGMGKKSIAFSLTTIKFVNLGLISSKRNLKIAITQKPIDGFFFGPFCVHMGIVLQKMHSQLCCNSQGLERATSHMCWAFFSYDRKNLFPKATMEERHFTMLPDLVIWTLVE